MATGRLKLTDEIVIPEKIKVHLGEPEAPARIISVDFRDYIKTVSACEIYPAWPQAAQEAAVYLIISKALNRLFTKWYEKDGYDITGDAAFDQEYIHESKTYENIDALVDNIFNRYVRREGHREPIFVTPQENFHANAVAMAEQGYNALEILRSLVQKDIQIVETLNIEGVEKQYPGFIIREGMNGEFVKHLQICLNRISELNPEIPTTHDDGYFGPETTAAVNAFLHNNSGAVDKPGWYKICLSSPKIRHAPGLTGARGKFNMFEMASLLLISRLKK